MDIELMRIFYDVTVDDLGLIRQFVSDTALAQGCDIAALSELIVAVNEATTNIVVHGYQEKPGIISVTVVCSRSLVEVRLVDDAPCFDPLTVPSPDTTLPLAERPFGGLGIHMMHNFCDELNYRVAADGRNVLIMQKRFER